MLLGAACTGRVVAVMSSPPHRTWNSNDSGSKARTLENLWGSYESGDTGFRENLLAIQDMFLWSLSSAARGTAIPYLKELPSPVVAWSDTSAQGIRPDSFWSPEAWASFARWSRVELIEFCQGSLGHSWLHPTMIATNLPMKHLTGLPRKGNPQPTSSPRATGGTAWSIGFRKEVVEALDGKVKGPSLDELDSRISEGLRAATGSSAGTCDSDTQSGSSTSFLSQWAKCHFPMTHPLMCVWKLLRWRSVKNGAHISCEATCHTVVTVSFA